MNLENKTAVFNILGPIILNGISFFTIPIFTRLLGPEQYGVVAVYTTWVGIFPLSLVSRSREASGRPWSITRKRDEVLSIFYLDYGTSFLTRLPCCRMDFSKQLVSWLLLDTTELSLMGLQSVGAFVIAFSGIAFIFYKNAKRNFLVNVSTALLTTALSLLLILCYFPSDKLYLGKCTAWLSPSPLWGRAWQFILSKRAMGLLISDTSNFACPSVSLWFSWVVTDYSGPE